MHPCGEPSMIIAEPYPFPDIDEATKKSVRQAHKNLVHPHRDTFVRMLRLGGAKEEFITYAKRWQCPICLQSAAPKSQRPPMTRQQAVYDFNDTVAADLLTVHDVDGKAYEVLRLVCWGSRYHVAVLLKTKSSALVAKLFIRQWVNWAGAPRKLQGDRGGEFEGDFEAMLERLNIESYVAPTRARGNGDHLVGSVLGKEPADKAAWVLADSALAWAGHSPAGFGTLWPDGAQCP